MLKSEEKELFKHNNNNILFSLYFAKKEKIVKEDGVNYTYL